MDLSRLATASLIDDKPSHVQNISQVKQLAHYYKAIARGRSDRLTQHFSQPARKLSAVADSFQFRSAFSPRPCIPAVAECLFLPWDLEVWPVNEYITLTVEFDLRRCRCPDTNQTDTRQTNCFIRTTKAVGKNHNKSTTNYITLCLKWSTHLSCSLSKHCPN